MLVNLQLKFKIYVCGYNIAVYVSGKSAIIVIVYYDDSYVYTKDPCGIRLNFGGVVGTPYKNFKSDLYFVM